MAEDERRSDNEIEDLPEDPYAPTGLLIPDLLHPARPFFRTYSFDLIGFFGTWLLVAALLVVTIILARIGA